MSLNQIQLEIKENSKWLNEFVYHCVSTNKSIHTKINYHSDCIRFLHWYESKFHGPISKANGQVIIDYMDFLAKGGSITKTQRLARKIVYFVAKLFNVNRAKQIQQLLFIQVPLSISSRKRHLSTIKNFYEYLKQKYEEENKDFHINPVRPKLHNIKLKDIDIKHTKLLTEEDWQILDDKVYRGHDRLMIYLLYYAGLRLEELANLNIDDFDTEKKVISVKRKGGSLHIFRPQMANIIFTMLERYSLHTEIDEGPLFLNSKGKKLTKRSLHNRVMALFKKYGLSADLTPHSFRKACATRLYEKSKDLLEVRDYLNHKDAKVTQTYIDNHYLRAKKEKDFAKYTAEVNV
ncbi:MAG: tyrosine-type recombinase/integrase [Halobacteriovoraceae bacterium]|nr:tyrosine-type recombinase/integrase [Halobacteriovoraceae bacterium]